MAPRGKSQAARRGAQSTLAFGSKSRVTKPSLPIHSAKKQQTGPSEEVKPAKSPIVLSDAEVQPTVADVVIEEQAQEEIQKVSRSPEEELAAKISDNQLKQYWKAREAERKAPRVHQEGLTIHEKILRHFDLSSQYGPCIGIARMKRWNRANKLGLHPPIEVLAVLLKEDGKGNAKSERAHVDELMSSRFLTE